MGQSIIDNLIQQLFRNRVKELRELFADEERSLIKNEIGSRILEVEYLAAQLYGRDFAETL